MLPKRRRMAEMAGVAAIAAALAPLAHAAEHVVLRNGFEMDCRRHEAIDATHLRLYLNADGTSYQDLLSADVVRIDVVADPVAAAPSAVMDAADANAKDVKKGADVAVLLAVEGAAHHIDAALLASIVDAESGGRAHAVSHAGAGGLMQLMPGTARDLGVRDVFAADENIHGGTAYLDALLTRYGNNPLLALAAYNAGPAAVDRYHGIPPFRETRTYVARVMHLYNRMKLAEEKAARAAGAGSGASASVAAVASGLR